MDATIDALLDWAESITMLRLQQERGQSLHQFLPSRPLRLRETHLLDGVRRR